MRILYILVLCTFFVASSAQQKTNLVVHFDFDKAVPTASSQAELSMLIKGLNGLPVEKIVVKGYTDKSGTDNYNYKLSQQRAENVAAQLRNALPKTVSILTEFYGEKDLLTEDDNTQDRNRRVTIYITYQPQKAEEIKVTGFHEDVEEQQFAVNLDDTITVMGKEGTLIKIAPGSIQNKNGIAVKGNAQLLLKEYYEPGDIIVAGMHSTSEQGLLQTGGMFKLCILQNGDTMETKTKKKVEIRMPVRDRQLKNMNIYTRNHSAVNATQWQNSSIPFDMFQGYWLWPNVPKLMDVRPEYGIRFENWRVGSHYTLTEYPGPWICINCGKEYPTKRYEMYVTKTAKDTLEVKAKIKYRRWALKDFGVRNLDTSYRVVYKRAEYQSETTELNWINCDRFYNNPNVTNFYVTTPGYSGMNVMVYFKRLNAFMPAEVSKNSFRIAKVPAYEDVYIVAFGRNKDDYYFSSQPYRIEQNGQVAVASFIKTNKESFKKEIASINY